MGRELELEFTITPRLSRRVNPLMLTDLDLADDIALLSDRLVQAQELLSRVETECKVGLRLNLKKTEYLTFNLADEPLKTISNVTLKKVEDFKYLGSSWVKVSYTDFKVRSQPMGGRIWRRQQKTLVDILLKATGLKTVDEIANCMGALDVWQAMSTRERQR